MTDTESSEIYDVVVVGAGAAGIGVAVALRHAGIQNFVVCRACDKIGASFDLLAGRNPLHHALFPNQFNWHARSERDRDQNLSRVQFGGRASDG